MADTGRIFHQINQTILDNKSSVAKSHLIAKLLEIHFSNIKFSIKINFPKEINICLLM